MLDKIAKKIYISYKLNKIAEKVLKAELTNLQKSITDQYTHKRKKDLTFGDLFKNQRTYFSLTKSNLSIIQIPQQIQKIIDKEGYYCPDYRKGYVYKKDDKLKSKPVKLIKILNKGESDKDKFNQLKKQFDERLSTSRKQNIPCEICITHNPYDIAGMSTDRNWSSCMNLDGGAYSETPLKQVQYGGMCAYLIEKGDRNIEQPIARIAIKRLVGNNRDFIFVAENRIYGDIEFANDLNFMQQVVEKLQQSNELTLGNSKIFVRNDENSYSDSSINFIFKFKNNQEVLEEIKNNPDLINKNGFVSSLNLEQLYLIYDLLIENRKYHSIYTLFINNMLNENEQKKALDLFIETANTNLIQLLRQQMLSQKQVNYIIKKIIKDKQNFFIKLFLKNNYKLITNDMKNKLVETLFQKNMLNQLYELFIENFFNQEQRLNVIKKLIEYREYNLLDGILTDDNLNKQQFDLIFNIYILNMNITLESLFDILRFNNPPFLDEEQAQRIIQYMIKKPCPIHLYNLIWEKDKNIKEKDILNIIQTIIDHSKNMYFIRLLIRNKIPENILKQSIEYFLNKIHNDYDNGIINQTILEEIKEICSKMEK